MKELETDMHVTCRWLAASHVLAMIIRLNYWLIHTTALVFFHPQGQMKSHRALQSSLFL
jgi:hypothetical protein